MKRSANIKDSIMMPPPKARPKSRSDTSEELRKNLTESVINTSDNSALQDEFQKFFGSKFFKENEESELRKNDDELSISKSTSSDKINSLAQNTYQNIPQQCIQCVSINNNNIASSHSINCLQCSNNNNNNNTTIQNCKNSFNFNLVNYNYNYTQFSDDEENVESLEKLRRNLITDQSITESKSINTSINTSNASNKNNFIYKNFLKLQPPKDKKEVKMFVNNIMSYISDHEFDSNLVVLKVKIQTRDNDYKNKGLKFDYYKDSLVKMQRELISRICMLNEHEKKIEKGTFEMIKKKRKRSIEKEGEEESSSLDDDSNVSDGSSCSNLSVDSANSIKKAKLI